MVAQPWESRELPRLGDQERPLCNFAICRDPRAVRWGSSTILEGSVGRGTKSQAYDQAEGQLMYSQTDPRSCRTPRTLVLGLGFLPIEAGASGRL